MRIVSRYLVAAVAAALLIGCNGPSEKEWKVGVILSTTGAIAPYGKDNLAGINTAKMRIDREGGVFGRPIELIVNDDGGDPAQAVTIARRYADDNSVKIILGPTRTGCAVAVSKILPSLKIPMISVGSTGDWKGAFGGDFNDWTFRSTRADTSLIEPLLASAKRRYGIQRVAMISTNNDDWSMSVRKLYLEYIPKLGMELVADEMQTTSDTDRSPQLTKIRATRPDGFIVNVTANDASAIAAQSRRLGISARFLGTGGFANPATWKLAPPGTLNGTLVSENYYSDSPRQEVRRFANDYREKFGMVAPPYAAYGYDGLRLAVAALTAAGPDGDRDAVKKQLASIRGFEAVLGTLSFVDGRGDARKQSLILEIADDKYRLVE